MSHQVVLAATLTLVPLLAGPLAKQERERLIAHLERSRAAFIQSISGLADAQLKFRPSPESWTIAECAEHIAISEDNMFRDYQEKFLKLTPKGGTKSGTTDDEVLAYGTDRTKQRAKAEPSYVPKGRWPKMPDLLHQFRKSRDVTLSAARTTQEDLRARYLEPYNLDAYQWLLMISAHTQRHTLQIDEIKGSRGFPK